MIYFAVRPETHGMSPAGTKPRCAAAQQVVGYWNRTPFITFNSILERGRKVLA